jgi:hypothetical protein
MAKRTAYVMASTVDSWLSASIARIGTASESHPEPCASLWLCLGCRSLFCFCLEWGSSDLAFAGVDSCVLWTVSGACVLYLCQVSWALCRRDSRHCVHKPCANRSGVVDSWRRWWRRRWWWWWWWWWWRHAIPGRCWELGLHACHPHLRGARVVLSVSVVPHCPRLPVGARCSCTGACGAGPIPRPSPRPSPVQASSSSCCCCCGSGDPYVCLWLPFGDH